MATFSRAQTGLRPTRGGTALSAQRVQGIALHWPAMGKTRLASPASVMKSLRGWQAFHQNDRGWSDIGYQMAVDQAGNIYTLRGLAIQSGANGNATLNQRYCAVLMVVGEGEQPTPAMIAATRDLIAQARRRYPNAHKIVGHGDIRPGGTACPGPAVQALIDSNAFDPTQEDDMADYAAQLDRIEKNTVNLSIAADREKIRDETEARRGLQRSAALDSLTAGQKAIAEAIASAPSADLREALLEVQARMNDAFADALTADSAEATA